MWNLRVEFIEAESRAVVTGGGEVGGVGRWWPRAQSGSSVGD